MYFQNLLIFPPKPKSESEQNRCWYEDMSILMTGVQLTKRGFMVNFILLLGFLALYNIVPYALLQQVVGSSDELYIMAYGTYHLLITITLLFCMFFIRKINKVQNIYRCSIAILITLLLLLLTPKGPFGLMLIFAEGIFFSIGMLISLTYLWSLTISIERGRVAGFIGFLGIPFSHIVGQLAQSSDFLGIVILGVFNCLGILAIKLLKPENVTRLSNKKEEKGRYYEKRTILLYSIPWIIFSLMNFTLVRNISINVFQSVTSSIYFSLLVLQMTASGFGALAGGIIADFFGRRLALGFTLTLYGISTALGGIAQSTEAFYFIYVINGLNWGFLWVLFGTVVWGDLATKDNSLKLYSIGLTFFYFAMGFGILLSEQISQIPLIVSSIVGCALIFLSNVPVMLAPELVPAFFREKIKLKLHMNTIKKILKKSQN